MRRLRQIPPEVCRFIAILAASAPAGNWVEIGTSAGYSTLWLALACQAVGRKITTFEILEEKAELTQQTFCKLRSSIGGVYAWRAQNSKDTEEKEGMGKEAEFAFRQAFVLCPSSPAAVFRYVILLIPQKRWDDAIRLTEAAVKLEEKARTATQALSPLQDFPRKPMIESRPEPGKMLTQLGGLLEQLKRMKQKQAKP